MSRILLDTTFLVDVERSDAELDAAIAAGDPGGRRPCGPSVR